MSLLLDALKKAAEQKARQADGDEATIAQSVSDSVLSEDDPSEAVYGDDLSDITELKFSADEIDAADAILANHTNDDELENTNDPQAISEQIAGDDQPDENQSDPASDVETAQQLPDQTDEEDSYDDKSEQLDASIVIDTGDDTVEPSFDEDETMSLLSNDDVSDFLGSRNSPDKAAGDANEDLSLSLVDYEAADAGESTPISNTSGANLEILAENEGYTNKLKLTDLEEDAAAAPSTTAINIDSLTNEHTITRVDLTSTSTDVSDRYDRSLLLQPDNIDISKTHSGENSQGNLMMTPEYAKKVFLSKSSASRVQHNKVYVGVATSILLIIGIFSLFEFQYESEQIDTALRPLKRDPMPGSIKPLKLDTSTPLFEQNALSEIDTQTLKILENARSTVNQIVEVATTEIALTEAVSEKENSELEPEKTKTSAVKITRTTGRPKDTKSNQASSGTLKITSNSKVTDKDRWLREAYDAYQIGDDVTALQKYNQVLGVDADNRNALLARAAISVQNGNSIDAIKDYQRLLVINPKDSLAMSSLISVASVSPQESESQLKLMIRLEPESHHLNFVLANVYGVQKRWQEAQSFYFKALENNPKDPNYAYNLAVSLEHIAKPKVAIAYYEKALVNFENGLATFNRDVVDSRLEVLRQL